jgi:hypothetical protein
MDFNFMNVVLHSVEHEASLSVQYIFDHIDSQAFSDRNYFVVMLSLEKILEVGMGRLLSKFLDDDMSSTTMRMKVVD